MAERFEEQSFGRCDVSPQFFLQILSWMFFKLVHMDDLHGTEPRPALDLVQTTLSQIWKVYEVGMRYEHLKRERVLHNDTTEITPNQKFVIVVLHSMVLTNCTPTPTPTVVGSVKHEPDDDVDLGVQECRIRSGILGSLKYLSIDRYDVQFETNACAKEMKQPTKASWTQLKRLARYLAGTQSARVALMKPGDDYDPHEAFQRVWSDSYWAGDANDRKKSIEFAN